MTNLWTRAPLEKVRLAVSALLYAETWRGLEVPRRTCYNDDRDCRGPTGVRIDGIGEQGRFHAPVVNTQLRRDRTHCMSTRQANSKSRQPRLSTSVVLSVQMRIFPSKSTPPDQRLRGNASESIIPNSTIDPAPSYLLKPGCLKRRWRKLCYMNVLHGRGVLHSDGLRVAHHKLLVQVVGFCRKEQTGYKVLSYGGVLEMTN